MKTLEKIMKKRSGEDDYIVEMVFSEKEPDEKKPEMVVKVQYYESQENQASEFLKEIAERLKKDVKVIEDWK